MKTRNLILSGALLAGLVMFSACDKSDSPNFDTDVETDVIEQSEAIEDIVESVIDEIDAALASDLEVAGEAALKSAAEEVGCPTVTVDRPEDARYPKVVTFDYGTENCEDRHGRMKRGKVIVTKTGPHWTEGSERTVVFEDFFVNDNAVEGSRTYRNEGQNEDGNWEFSTTVNVTVTTIEEISWTRAADKIRTLVAGADTKNVWDDEFLITGTSSGASSEGYSVAREITTPLLKKRVCRFPVSGVIEIVRSKDETSVTVLLDYGTGECDNKATVTDEEGNVEEIMLGRKFKARK